MIDYEARDLKIAAFVVLLLFAAVMFGCCVHTVREIWVSKDAEHCTCDVQECSVRGGDGLCAYCSTACDEAQCRRCSEGSRRWSR